MAVSLKKRVNRILQEFDSRYGTEAATYLEHDASRAWQLLFATILSAQCTDARVNMVTKDLYRKYPDLKSFADCDVKELEQDIHSTGFFHSKARNIKASAQMLLAEYGGEIPQTLEELTKLPGVGRKTANLMLSQFYGQDAIVVDTHVGRISRKLGLTAETDPAKVEADLQKVLPRDHWSAFNVQGIAFGRTICRAPKPKCGECYLADICPSFKTVPGKD